MKIAFIGFGEAGPVFASAFLKNGHSVSAYDVLTDHKTTQDAQIQKTHEWGATVALTVDDAVRDAEIIISTVTASQALVAAEKVAEAIGEGQTFIDFNSCAPATKRAMAEKVMQAGAEFVEVTAMDTVPVRGLKVPLLLAGPKAETWETRLAEFGFNPKAIGPDIGQAASIKLSRSIIIKGLEAIFAEATEVADRLGVTEPVWDSIKGTFPELDWDRVAGYHLSRASIHAKRRAAEMRESAAMVEDAGLSSTMASAIATKMEELDARNMKAGYEGESICGFTAQARSNPTLKKDQA